MRRKAAGIVWAWISLVAVACQPSAGRSGTEIRLVVTDGHIRAPGDECAGSGPYLYVHAEASYAVEDAGGKVIAGGRLPAGRAIEADPSIGWTVPRVPTFCALEFAVADLPSGSYRIRLEGGEPLPFELPGDLDEDGALVLVVS